MAEPVDYSKVEHKDPYEDIVAAYDDAQLIKDAEYRLAHMIDIPNAAERDNELTADGLNYFKELLAKKKRSKLDEINFKIVKRTLVSEILYYQNYEDNREKFGRAYNREAEWEHKTGLQEKDDYYFAKSRRNDKQEGLFRGWKFHLDVNPTPEDPLTKEISEFLQTLDVEHKIAHGGMNGKGMTVYTGSYEDTRKVAQLVYERFHDRMELPPLWNENLMGEHFFNPLACGRFLDSGHPFPTMYPAVNTEAPGISEIPFFAKMQGSAKIDVDDYIDKLNAQIEQGVPSSVTPYTMHKLYAQEFGEYYHGADLDKFEQTFFGDSLPKKGSAARKKLDEAADANIAFIKEHTGKDLTALKNIIDNYIPIDFSKTDERISENAAQAQTPQQQNDNGRTTMADDTKMTEEPKAEDMKFLEDMQILADGFIAMQMLINAKILSEDNLPTEFLEVFDKDALEQYSRAKLQKGKDLSIEEQTSLVRQLIEASGDGMKIIREEWNKIPPQNYEELRHGLEVLIKKVPEIVASWNNMTPEEQAELRKNPEKWRAWEKQILNEKTTTEENVVTQEATTKTKSRGQTEKVDAAENNNGRTTMADNTKKSEQRTAFNQEQFDELKKLMTDDPHLSALHDYLLNEYISFRTMAAFYAYAQNPDNWPSKKLNPEIFHAIGSRYWDNYKGRQEADAWVKSTTPDDAEMLRNIAGLFEHYGEMVESLKSSYVKAYKKLAENWHIVVASEKEQEGKAKEEQAQTKKADNTQDLEQRAAFNQEQFDELKKRMSDDRDMSELRDYMEKNDISFRTMAAFNTYAENSKNWPGGKRNPHIFDAVNTMYWHGNKGSAAAVAWVQSTIKDDAEMLQNISDFMDYGNLHRFSKEHPYHSVVKKLNDNWHIVEAYEKEQENAKEAQELADVEFLEFMRTTALRNHTKELEKYAQKRKKAFKDLSVDETMEAITQVLQDRGADIKLMRERWDKMTPEQRAEIRREAVEVDKWLEDILKQEAAKEKEAKEKETKAKAAKEKEVKEKEAKAKAAKEKENKSKEAQPTQRDDMEYRRDLLYKKFLEMAGTRYTGENAVRERREEMDTFVSEKDEFLKSYAEKKVEGIDDIKAKNDAFIQFYDQIESEINAQLRKFIMTEGNEVVWHDEPYRINDEFKRYYQERFHPENKKKEEKSKETQKTESQTIVAGGNDGQGSDTGKEQNIDSGLPKGFNPLHMTFDNVGKNNGDKDNVGKNNGDKDNGGKDNGGKDNNEKGGKGPKTQPQVIVVGGNGGNDNGGKNNGGKVQETETQNVTAGGQGGNGGEPPLLQQYEIVREDIRIRSHDNYDNTTMMYTVELELLHNKKMISDGDFAKAHTVLLNEIRERDLYNGLPIGQVPEQIVSQEDMVKARQLVEKTRDQIPQNRVGQYKSELADAIATKALVQDGKYITLLTPELTATAIEGYSEALQQNSQDKSKRQVLENKYRVVLNHGENLLHNLNDKRGYYFTDITNAADEYDGYMHLADVCEKKDVERKQQAKSADTKAEPHYEQARNLMKEYIKPYDELYHIPTSKDANTELTKNPKNTAIKLTARMADAAKIIDKLEFNEDTLGKEYLEAMQNFRFVEEYDKDGNPKYEKSIVLNADGKMEVVKGSRLDTALRFAANEGMIQDLGDFDKKITKENILEGAKDNAFKTLFAYANSEEVLKKGLKENPQKFTDPKYLEQFTRDLMSGQKAIDISPLANDLALKRQTNNIEVYGNRIAGKVGAANAQYLKAGLARQVQKIDGSSKNTKDNAAYLKKKATWRNIASALASGGISAAVAYASTKLSLGSTIGNFVGITASKTAVAGGIGAELAAGGTSALVGAVAGAAVATVSYLAVRKVGAMLKRQKYGWKDVKNDLKSSAFKTALVAGALGGASVGFATSGCPQCALLCGIGSVSVAGAGRYVRSYKDMRLNGHGKVASVAMGALNAIAVPVGAKLGFDFAMSGVNTHETVTATAEEAKQLYGKDGSNLAQSQKDGWHFESSDHQQPGYTLLDQKSSNVGPYHHYNAQEHNWADMRNDGVRWSEYLVNNGKDGLHVHPDFQNGTGGLNHDQALLDNAIKSLDEAAKQPGNEWMNSLVDGKPKSNSDMLFYKLYQKVVLVPNDNVQLADGSGTVGDVYNVDADHTANGVFQKLLHGDKLDAQDLGVIRRVEDNIGGEIHEGYNGMGEVHDVVGSTHPTHRVDSFTFGDKGYDELNQTDTTSLFGKFTRAVEHVPGFGALFFTLPRKVKEFLRPGAKADQRKIIEEKVPVEPPVVVPPVEPPVNPPVEPPVVVPPVIHPKPEEQQLLIEEYWMIHGYNPAVREMKDKNGKPLKDEHGHIQKMEINPMAFDAGYKAYVQNVEKERVAKGGKPMFEFLQERRAEMDQVINDQTASYLGGHNARLNADILDPVGYKQVLKKQAELKAEGKSMSKDDVDKAILWPSPEKLADNYKEHRPTSKLCKIIRDSFWRKDNKVDIKDPKQRSTVEMDDKDAKSDIEIIGPNKKVFSFYDFIKSAKDTLVRTTEETGRDETKAPRRRTLDEMGKMRRTKQSQH